MKIQGNLIITKENQDNNKELTEVSGSIYFRENATLSAPKLTEVSGGIYVEENATLSAPKLTMSGWISIRENATLSAPKLTEVSGWISIRENATLSAPKLTTVGEIYVYENATLNIDLLKGLKQRSVDRSLFIIESEKEVKGIQVYKGYNVNKITRGELIKDNCYVAEKDNFTAHGKTIKKAIEDLNFKINSEKLKKDPINADTLLTKKHYRLITGACEFGVNEFMKQHNLTKESYRADEIIPILKKTNAYGFQQIEKLINF